MSQSRIQAALAGVSAAFGSLGGAAICLDDDLRVVYASPRLAQLAGSDVASAIVGRPIAELLGDELFGSAGVLSAALRDGETREGWCTALPVAGGGSRMVTVTAAPFAADEHGLAGTPVKFVVVLRPCEEDPIAGTAAPVAFFGMVGRSAAMARIFALVQNLPAHERHLLLTGENGTGKEVLARAIHAHSPRRRARFIAVDCTALPGELPDDILDLAAGGTLFLDEVAHIPLQPQATLLQPADVRIIAATSVDLRRAVAESRFREDLYHRLRAVAIDLPPLRARHEDIEPLAQCLLARVSARHGRTLRLAPDALRAMLRYAWPGNAREMEDALERAVAVARGRVVRADDLPRPMLQPEGSLSRAGEAAKVRAALEEHRWNRDATARALGISRTTLWRKMRELGLS